MRSFRLPGAATAGCWSSIRGREASPTGRSPKSPNTSSPATSSSPTTPGSSGAGSSRRSRPAAASRSSSSAFSRPTGCSRGFGSARSPGPACSCRSRAAAASWCGPGARSCSSWKSSAPTTPDSSSSKPVRCRSRPTFAARRTTRTPSAIRPVYARRPGAVAAPTAGLHFDERLLGALEARGVEIAHVTLHVGAGTFAPIRGESVRSHTLHREWVDVSAATCECDRTRSFARRAGGERRYHDPAGARECRGRTGLGAADAAGRRSCSSTRATNFVAWTCC